MTVPIVELEAELAPLALMKKLADAGYAPHSHGDNVHAFQVAWDGASRRDLVDTITTFLMVDWCYEYMDRRVGTLHDYLTDDEREYVALLTFHGMMKTEETVAGRTHDTWRNVVAESVEMALDSDPAYILLDSLARFRLKDFLALVDESIHEVVEQFLADREYEEFVAMLRYMLDTQKPSAQTYHLFCTDERVWISDASGELVKDTAVSEAAYMATKDGEVNPEDLAMSILITKSPSNIVIHDLSQHAPWPSFPETVERIFLSRAERCKDCTTCQKLKQTQTRPVEWTRKVSPDSCE